MEESVAQHLSPRIVVLLATYNGASFLDEQIESLFAQDVANLDVMVNDDASDDETISILRRWQSRWSKGKFYIFCSPHRGVAENFRRLAIRSSAGSDYFAFCDQDDLWDPDKLSTAIAALAEHGRDGPAIYFSRTRLVDACGRPCGYSPLFNRRPSFRNAIVQSIGGGNTMVMNATGFRLFVESARRTSFVCHDWWGYIIVSGAGGHVYYDPQPHIGYRQHGANSVGSNVGMRAGFRRLGRQFSGAFANWNTTHVAALGKCIDLLSPASRTTLAEFTAMRKTRLLAGLVRLRRSGIRRQTVRGNIALAVAVALGMT